MPHPCPHHCPKGGSGAGFAVAAIAVVILAAAIAKPAEHAAEDVLHVVIVCLEILAAAVVITAATALALFVRRHVRASHAAALPAGATVRVRSATPAAAIAPHAVLDGTVVDMATVRERNAR